MTVEDIWASVALPENIELNGSFLPSFEAGGEILVKYCHSCTKKKDCEMKSGLSEAMGENYPLWFNAHVPVRTERVGDYFGFFGSHVFCDKYESPQKNLPGIEKDNSDGIERLREVSGLALV